MVQCLPASGITRVSGQKDAEICLVRARNRLFTPHAGSRQRSLRDESACFLLWKALWWSKATRTAIFAPWRTRKWRLDGSVNCFSPRNRRKEKRSWSVRRSPIHSLCVSHGYEPTPRLFRTRIALLCENNVALASPIVGRGRLTVHFNYLAHIVRMWNFPQTPALITNCKLGYFVCMFQSSFSLGHGSKPQTFSTPAEFRFFSRRFSWLPLAFFKWIHLKKASRTLPKRREEQKVPLVYRMFVILYAWYICTIHIRLRLY